jgi:hypothetical protein
MVYTRKNIKNLTGGVSQQPDSERFDNQCSEQKNFLSDPIKGLTKRAGTNYVQYIDDGEASLQHPAKNTFTHVINRSTSEQLMLCIGYDGSGADATPDISLFKLNTEDASLEKLDVKDADGNALDGTELDYLDITNEQETHPYSAVTIADYTFIANSDITPALKATTSGGTGMYERDHVKRGIIFVREGAFDSEYTIRATDSEGNTRLIRARTTNSGQGASGGASGKTGTMDARSDLIAGALHKCLEAGEDSATNVAFTTSSSASYTDASTNIRYTWSDDSDNFIFNKSSQGSNYDGGNVAFTGQPSTNDKITITGCDSSNTVKVFEFGGTGSDVNVTIGTTLLDTMENLVTAINNLTGTLDLKAHLVYDETESNYKVHVHSTREGATDAAARAGNMVETTDSGNVMTVTAIQGAVDDPSDGSGLSTAPVRNQIHFQRQIAKTGGDTIGSIISWYASYATKEDADASPINIEITDSYGDTMTSSYTDVLEGVEALPKFAPNNYVLKIEGNEENEKDDYYVKFTADDENATKNEFSLGKWKETLNIGLQYQIDPATMPHQLVKHSSTEYRFKPATWSDKSVGDASSDPAPQFIGNPIRDIFFYKSRLGVLAGESVVLSEVDNAFNFWRTSVANLLDSDRIDITSSVNEITYLNWAIPFANQLVIFSDRAQFLLTQGNQGLTPSTAALSLGSSYENSTLCRPVANDNSIIFAQEKSGASAVYEMYPTGSTEISFEAKSISEHIPSYISGKITKISASSLASTVVVQTDTGDNTLYIYKYYNQGDKRVQSAWSKYELACNYIKGGHFISDKFHIIEGHHDDSSTVVSDCHWILTYMKFDNTDSLTNSIDLYFNVPSGDVDNSGSDTTLAMEWDIRDNSARKAKIVAFNKSDNTTYTVADSGANNVVTLTGVNLADNANIVVGLKFEASYEFSKQYIKRGGRDGKEVAITDGRTTTKWYEVYFNDTQFIKSTVSFPAYANRTSSVKEYTGSFSGGAVTGDQPSETSTLRTSVAARSDLPTITLSSDTHQTVTITGAAFELMHTSRLSRTN